MKTKEEIEQLAKDFIEERGLKVFNKEIETAPLDEKATHFLQLGIKLGFRTAYTQCQEDMAKKKYTEEDIRNAVRMFFPLSVDDIVKLDKFINSLNKQDK